jgi:Caspase domain
VLRWQVNRGWDQAGESIPVAEIPLLRRPRALPIVLQEMETARALGLDDLQEVMRAVQLRARSSVPPGARLHLLAIGVSDYGEAARHLKLNYALKDAEDIANALLSTQTSLYADVIPQVLRDDEATEGSILRGLAQLRQNMATGEPGQDLAVIHFSGHGAMGDGTFFLLPYGVDARDAIGITPSALPIATLREELRKIGEHARATMIATA